MPSSIGGSAKCNIRSGTPERARPSSDVVSSDTYEWLATIAHDEAAVKAINETNLMSTVSSYGWDDDLDNRDEECDEDCCESVPTIQGTDFDEAVGSFSMEGTL